MKLRSCLTLFLQAEPAEPVVPADPAFRELLDRWFDGRADEATLRAL